MNSTVLLFLLAGLNAAQAKDAPRPNIVVIMADATETMNDFARMEGRNVSYYLHPLRCWVGVARKNDCD